MCHSLPLTFFFLIVSNSGYLHHLGLFSCNGFHMFLRRYHHIRKKNKTKKPQNNSPKLKHFGSRWWLLGKPQSIKKLPPAVTVSCRDGREIANNDWLLLLTNKNEWALWSHRAVNSITGNLSFDENNDRRIETDCVVVMMNPGKKRCRTKCMSGCLLGSYLIFWTLCP